MKKSSRVSKTNSKTKPPSSGEQFARQIARRIYDKKGLEIMIFDLREMSPITDYFVITHGLSNIHNQTIAEYLIQDHNPNHLEGFEQGTWILIDFFDVIVHIFSKETREFYGLERLWGDAPQVKFNDD